MVRTAPMSKMQVLIRPCTHRHCQAPQCGAVTKWKGTVANELAPATVAHLVPRSADGKDYHNDCWLFDTKANRWLRKHKGYVPVRLPAPVPLRRSSPATTERQTRVKSDAANAWARALPRDVVTGTAGLFMPASSSTTIGLWSGTRWSGVGRMLRLPVVLSLLLSLDPPSPFLSLYDRRPPRSSPPSAAVSPTHTKDILCWDPARLYNARLL